MGLIDEQDTIIKGPMGLAPTPSNPDTRGGSGSSPRPLAPPREPESPQAAGFQARVQPTSWVSNHLLGPPLAASANSKGPPEFSSYLPGARAHSRLGSEPAAGRKATKKTDKPRQDDKDDLDLTELTNEDLLDQLVKYGVNPGPIVGTTRKLYEKKLLKLREQGTESRSSPSAMISSSAENTRQNGSNDSDRYSDNEEDSKIELKLEKREPLKSRAKTLVTLKQRRVQHNESYSQAGITGTEWTSGSSKGGPLQALLTRESTRGSRRTPRKRMHTSEYFRIDGAVISASTPVAESIMASNNKSLVVNRVTGNFKHAFPILPVTEFSDIPRRTPKKPLTRAEAGEKTQERRVERDILKEMFPYEASTPTRISASYHRTIKAAAGRPLELSDLRMEELFSSTYVPKYVPLCQVTKYKKKGCSIPVWIKILLFVVAVFVVCLGYQAVETNHVNPFSDILPDDSRKPN
ncbi:LOW QUALITY PROTEIN: lamina-associated polypeptide 2, isoforms beta/gamma-like [Symphalangus syndactylus]|uniref:LOW QUALITY PROTEIN: lamina-associated polypeptide 2, isoforms beta/gamma-like n=1 Tax=Symphalangus syndactylus TaxID=9590 RepID=UPI002442F55B|nr:LOW QUALITY PROTEIN: lamina-associated polypeptide 2, isoforms beta/gamma-like [Symphalangus syndactylus]